MSRHLQVFPELLEFPMRLGTDTLLTASLRNASASYLAFKVKTTATDRYRVRPNLGVVAPGETAHVKLVLVAQEEFGPQLSNCRDRFLVQSLPILPGQKPDGAAFRAQKFKIQDHKLRVSIIEESGPGVPPDASMLDHSDREGGGGKHLNTDVSPLEKEIRYSLMSIAEEQGSDGHRACLTKFSELLLLNGIISTQQMGVALDLVELLFEQEPERPEATELSRSVHTWLEESEESGTHSEGNKSSPSHAAVSATAAFVNSVPPPTAGCRGIGGLGTVQSGTPTSGPPGTSSPARGLRARASALRPSAPSPDPHTARPQDLFPSPPESSTSGGAAGDMAYDRDNGSSIGGDGQGFETPPQLLSPVPRPPLYSDGGPKGAANGNMSTRFTAAGQASDSPNDPYFTGGYANDPGASDVYGNGDGGAARQNSMSSDRGTLTPPNHVSRASVSSDWGVPESPARNLAAMLRSTLRNPGPNGAAMREALTSSPDPSPRHTNAMDSTLQNSQESFSRLSGRLEGLANA